MKDRNSNILLPSDFGMTTKLFLLLGNPVSHSLSPRLHNIGFQTFGLNMIYLAVKIESNQLSSAVKSIRTLNIAGANITIPFKVQIIPYLDRIDPTARKVRAVNTIVNVEGALWGYNTDFTGFLDTLQAYRFNPEDTRVLVLGAGGAASAVGWALVEQVDTLIIANRTPQRAIQLHKRLNNQGNVRWVPWSEVAVEVEKSDLIVNATSVGLASNPSFEFLSLLNPPKTATVFDLVYSHEETQLIQYMRKKGVRTIDGKELLVRQALDAFELWTGQRPKEKVFFSVLSKDISM
ncbi:MAG: shikimate dehydrogenase [Promethearchaeota archaeon]